MGQIGPGFLSLPYRTPKPRSDGLTHVLDKGLSLFALESLIQTAGDAIDIVKLGWGTSYVMIADPVPWASFSLKSTEDGWRAMPRGDRFTALVHPQLLVDDLRAAARAWR